jgi:hypothetical protein
VSLSTETLFSYPVYPHTRRHGPRGYSNYISFKPWLRDDFSFRCVYCLFRERWFPNGAAAFSVDHLEPHASAPERTCNYTNLAYACLTCNSTKRDQRLPGLCVVGYATLLLVREDGNIEGMTPDGQAMLDKLGLNHPRLREFRGRLISLLRRIQRTASGQQSDLRKWFGYPENLPELLALRPPGGNDRSKGIAQSYRERQRRGELPDAY